MSIKKSLRILLIISSMIPVILMSVIIYILMTDRLNIVNSNTLQQIAEANKSGLDAMVDIQRTEVSLLAIQNELVGLVNLSNRTSTYSPDKVDKILSTRCADYGSCEYISLFNINKEIVASSDASLVGITGNYDTLIKNLFLTRKIVVDANGLSPLVESYPAVYTIDIGCPIIDSTNNSVTGYVISTIDTSYFNNFLKSISFGKTGGGILLNRSGTIIYHPDSSLIGQNINSEQLSQVLNDYNAGTSPVSGSFNIIYDNISQSYGYCVLPDLDWVLLVRQDLSEIHSPMNIVPVVLFCICAGILFLVIIFSNTLAKKISEPIVSLRDAMRTASNGNLTVQSNIKSNNELGELSKNFNKMLHIIKTNYEDLASMHDELLSNEEQLRSNYDHIEFLAYHDTLTNLPNKIAFLDYVNAVLVSSSPHQKTHAVYFVDLDNFKTVNDTLGHEYGDALLVKTAQLLSSILGENGMLARAGGDEFLLFKEDISFKENAVEFAAQVIDCFRNPLDLDGETVHVSMSIGISLYPENGLSPNTLIKNSDIAMYKSKDTGKNKYTLFDLVMEEELSRNTIIIEILRNAIISREIYIQYQPLFELESNSVVGFEALMRIKSERLGSLSPSEFIPIAEESGLINELSSWLLREACAFNKNLIDCGAVPRPVSVNISSVQINRPGFITLLSKILEETQLPPKYLELEITESTLVSSIMDATKLLTKLQDLGVSVSLDDFGTGYSSLNYLTKMPINTLKIDKSFIDNICINDKDSCIAESIIQLAHSLNIKVVAEGVEQDDQLIMLRAQHCDIIQGFIYSAPLHPSALIEVLKEDDLISQFSLF